jgi:hypothetical protein
MKVSSSYLKNGVFMIVSDAKKRGKLMIWEREGEMLRYVLE